MDKEKVKHFNPLDIVQHKDGSVGIIQEGVDRCSIIWLEGSKQMISAWWKYDEMSKQLKVIGNIPNIVTTMAAHPFGDGAKYADKVYPFGKY